ncbi:39145_t:CDS:2, partial [Gigaspora margarita]
MWFLSKKLSNEHINHHTPQQRVYYHNLFNRNQYPSRRITAGSTSNPEQTTTTSTSIHPALRATTSTSSVLALTLSVIFSQLGHSIQITAGSVSNLLEQIIETARQTTIGTSSKQPVVDIMPKSRAASDEEESSDSTWLPAEFSEQCTKESTKESSEQKNHDLIKENEVLKRENKAFKMVISHSAGIYSNNEERYE